MVRRAGHDDRVAGEVAPEIVGGHDRRDTGRRDRSRALGRRHARVQRDERAAGIPHAEPRRDRRGDVREQHADGLPGRDRARAQVRAETRRERRAARRASSRVVARVRDDFVTGRPSSSVGERRSRRSRRAAGDPRPRADGRCAAGERRVDEQRALDVGTERDEPRAATARARRRPTLARSAPTSASRGAPRSRSPRCRCASRRGTRRRGAGRAPSIVPIPTSSIASRNAADRARPASSPVRARTRRRCTPSAMSSSIVGLHGSGRRCDRTHPAAVARRPPTTRRATGSCSAGTPRARARSCRRDRPSLRAPTC